MKDLRDGGNSVPVLRRSASTHSNADSLVHPEIGPRSTIRREDARFVVGVPLI